MKVVNYVGVNGRRIGVDLEKLHAVEEGDDCTKLFMTPNDWYIVRTPFDKVMHDWKANDV